MGQTISTTQFFLFGKRHFTRTGYMNHIKNYYTAPVQSQAIAAGGASDGVNLSGKAVVVTGANSGLGFQVTQYAASKGASVYMLCRSQERAAKARDTILEQVPEADLTIVEVDVGELDQVRKAAKQVSDEQESIHAVVCNAGVLLNDYQTTKEGNEATFASHLLGGSYLLTQLLLPQLQKATDSRVIMVTSGGMYNTKLPAWDVLTSADGGDNNKSYDGVMAYAYAKRGQVILTEQMAKLHPDVKWVTVHPGWADTAAVEDAFGSNKKYLEPLRNPWEGAEGVAWLVGCGATGNALENGALYLDRKTQPKHIAGPFFTEGSFTKNTPLEIEKFMKNLKMAAGL